MPSEIVVPELGESIVEATVSRWLKAEGERVAVGEAVVELETEKVNLEVSAEQDGLLARIERQEGEDVEIGDLLGVIEEAPAEQEPEPDEETQEAAAETEETAEEAGEAPPPAAQKADREETTGVPEQVDEKVTPMAVRLAREHEIDLAEVARADERVTRADVERYLEEQKAEPEPEEEVEPEPETAEKEAPPPVAGRPEREERVRMTRRRRTIARRLVEAQQSAAMLTTFNEIDLGAVVELRQRRRDSFQERHGVKLGFMSFFVKASVGALKQFPRLNAEIDGREIILKHYYDIGIAIGAKEGLVVPVLRNADRMGFAEVEQTIESYAEKAKEGALSLQELQGGTFSITNGGVFGSLLSTPILNPPQVGILGLHKIEKRPVVLEDEVTVRPMMYVALSYDHRIVDGREAVQFLVRVKELIEDPEVLLLEG